MSDAATPPRATRVTVLIVGVTATQPDAVVRGALSLASQLEARLVLASVDDSRYTVRHDPHGMVAAYSFDSDAAEVVYESFDPRLERHLAALMGPSGIEWQVKALAGEPAHELAGLADELDALAIVVGTRRPGLRGSAAEFFSGSVAVHLAHRQHRPVIVIPLHPVAPDEAAPWQGG